MASSATVKWNQAEIAQIKRKFMAGMVSMGMAMNNRAKTNAPVLTGALRNSIRTTQSGDQVVVTAGGTISRFSVDYAELREFHNNKNPQTKYYMTRAFNTIVKGDINQYFKGIA